MPVNSLVEINSFNYLNFITKQRRFYSHKAGYAFLIQTSAPFDVFTRITISEIYFSPLKNVDN